MTPTWSQRSDRSLRSLPYQIQRIDELPGNLGAAASAALPSGAETGFIFVAPADAFPSGIFGVRRAPEQALVFTQDGVLHIQAAASEKLAPKATYFAGNDLLYLQSGLLLLYGRIELAGLVDGALARAVIEYNTIGWEMVQPSLQRLVRLAAKPIEMATLLAREAPGRESLVYGLPYKFANGVRLFAAHEGETLLGIAFQPDLWVPYFGVFRRQLTPKTLLALTDRCVVLIEEEPAATRKNAQYGWVFSYMPLSVIADMRFTQLETRQALTILMQRGDASAERRLVLDNGPARAWRELWAAYAQSVCK